MTLEEFDNKAGELFELLKKAEEAGDPRSKEDYLIIRTIAMLGVEFIADQKRIVDKLEFISQGITSLVDVAAAGYQNGIIVKIANELEFNAEGLDEEIKNAAREAFSGGEEAEKQEVEAIEKAEVDNSSGHRDDRTD